jgi:hypothetical protein
MDDSRVSSLDRQTHLRHLKAFFTALAANGLAINLENVFLQHLLWKSFDTGFRQQKQPPQLPKLQIVPPPPQDTKQLQRFLGMVNFYSHFLPNCAQVLKPLIDLLKGGQKP